jgi:hypothetical protein
MGSLLELQGLVRGLLPTLNPEFQREDQQGFGRERSQARALLSLIPLS